MVYDCIKCLGIPLLEAGLAAPILKDKQEKPIL